MKTHIIRPHDATLSDELNTSTECELDEYLTATRYSVTPPKDSLYESSPTPKNSKSQQAVQPTQLHTLTYMQPDEVVYTEAPRQNRINTNLQRRSPPKAPFGLSHKATDRHTSAAAAIVPAPALSDAALLESPAPGAPLSRSSSRQPAQLPLKLYRLLKP